ncbi:MAG: replicative DNA helicase [Pseudomonadota bacterium]
MTTIPNPSLPPQNLEAEQAVLGSMLIDADVCRELADTLSPEDFYREANANVFRAMRALLAAHQPVDLVTLTGQMRADKTLEQAGGVAYLTALANATPTAANGVHYAEAVRAAHRGRLLQAACRKALGRIGETTDYGTVIREAEAEILAIARDVGRGREPVKLFDILAERVKAYEKPPKGGVDTGFSNLDAIIGGMSPGDLVILGARSTMGKTSLLRVIARQVAGKGTPVLFFSLEMPKEQQADMLMASEGRINTLDIRSHSFDDRGWKAIRRAFARLGELPLYIDDEGGLSASEIRARARRFKSKVPDLGLVCVDYLQIMRPERRGDNRTQELGETTGILKNTARELGLPLLVLSQLSREVDKRAGKDHRPTLPDLRDSGAIEQDADIVMFIYREDYYDKTTPKQGIAEIIVAKHRNGPPGTVEVKWLKEYATFAPLDTKHVPEEDDDAPWP